MTTSSTRTSSPAGSRQRVAGAIGVWAGLLGAASGALLLGYPEQVTDDRWSYPFDATGFTVIQTFFFVQHLGLAVVVAALWTSGVAGRGGFGRIAVSGSVVSMLGLAVVELAAIGARDSAYPSPRSDTLEIWYGVTSVGIGLFLVLAGVAVVRARVWSGWERWLPLALGIYVFVPLTPGIAAGFVSGRVVLIGWMLLFSLLGWVFWRPRS